MKSKTYIIGIAGASGSGKTTVAAKLAEKFSKEDVLLISQDAYYKDLSNLSIEEKTQQNFDHPDSLDFKLIKQHIVKLKNGQKIEQPIYNFNTHCRENSTVNLKPKSILIIEGTLLFSQQDLITEFDNTIFIKLDQNTCFKRRLKRDLAERGRTKEEVIEQYKSTVQPMYEQFIKPSELNANITIPGEDNDKHIKRLYKDIIEDIKNMSQNL